MSRQEDCGEAAFQASNRGSIMDLHGQVAIEQVYGGAFSNPEAIHIFCQIGVGSVEPTLSRDVRLVDFGGGTGVLAAAVTQFLEAKGHQVETTVADANSEFLKKAEAKGLQTKLCNLEDDQFSAVDLAIMRSVLHYNTMEKQGQILRRIHRALTPAGIFVNQFTTGTKQACALRSAIVNHALLGRSSADNHYLWVTVEEYGDLVRASGFSRVMLVGYAPDVTWGAREQWVRFKGQALEQARAAGDGEAVAQLEDERERYLADCAEVIERFICDNPASDTLGVEKQADGQVVIRSTYPIVVSTK